MSAHMIFERAPIGAIISWSDRSPCPPEHQVELYAAWKSNNTTGRLIRKSSGWIMGQAVIPSGFTVMTDGLDDSGAVAGTDYRWFPIGSDMRFLIAERPAIGSVRILDLVCGSPELVYLASSLDHAETWLRNLGTRTMVLEEVTADEVGADFVEGRIAA